jgi:hypothetical protein
MIPANGGYARYSNAEVRNAPACGGIRANSSSVYDDPCAQHVLDVIVALACPLPQARAGGKVGPCDRLQSSSSSNNPVELWNFPRRRGQSSEVSFSPLPVRLLTRLDRLSPRLFSQKRNFGSSVDFSLLSLPVIVVATFPDVS